MSLFKSTNGGANWSRYQIIKKESLGLALAVDPSNDDIIYVGGTSGSGALFQTKDGGSTWTKIGGNVITGPVNAIEVDPGFANRVYAGTFSGFYRSENLGSTWEKMADFSVNDIKINSESPNEVYAGGSGGVFKSVNSGTNWIELNASLGIKSVNSLDLIPANKTLFAGTSGGGIYMNRQLDLYLLALNATPGGATTPEPGIYTYQQGKKIEIRANPKTHHIFSGWSGDATGAKNPITLTMNSDKSITANFLRNIYAPQDFSGTKKENRSLLKVEYINVLKWKANPDNEASVTYRIYLVEGNARNLLKEVDAGTLGYWHRNVEKNKEYSYALTAADQTGREGQAASITVR